MCVCFLLYLSFFLCCARCVFCVLFYVHNQFFFSFLPSLFLQIQPTPMSRCRSLLIYTYSIAHMPVLLFLLHFYLSNSCVCVCQLVQTLPSSSTFTYNYHHKHLDMHFFTPCMECFQLCKHDCERNIRERDVD